MAYQRFHAERAIAIPAATEFNVNANNPSISRTLSSSNGAVVVVDSGGIISEVTFPNRVNWFATVPTVTITGASGTLATFNTPTLDSENNLVVTVNAGGSGYTGPYTITFTGGTYINSAKAQPFLVYVGGQTGLQYIDGVTSGGDNIRVTSPALGEVIPIMFTSLTSSTTATSLYALW